MSQEQLAEKLLVSRQAITKWETGAGMPDVENLLAIAALFGTSVDELLSAEKQLKSSDGFFHESTVEYDIDSPKHYDIKIWGAYAVAVAAGDGEKLHVRLASNAIAQLEQLLKVKLDERKNSIDVDIRRDDKLSEAQAKEALYIFITVPAKYTAGIELASHAHSLSITGVKAESIELDGKLTDVQLLGVEGSVEFSCSTDLTVTCDSLPEAISFNQISATSVIHIPSGSQYEVKKKGASNRVDYMLDGKAAPAPTHPDAKSVIKLMGFSSELIINEYSATCGEGSR